MKSTFLLIGLIISLSSLAQEFDKEELINNMKILSSDEMEGRKTGTEGNEKAQQFIVQQFKEAGLVPYQDDYLQPFVFDQKEKKITGKNIVGYLPGKAENAIVVTAHYDHLGQKEDRIFNGADDNASGTSALITMIKYFKQNPTNHTLIFVAFDAEEMGLQGAKAFVNTPSVNLNKIKLNVNMDMVSHNDKNELYACGTLHYPSLKPLLERVDKKTKVNLKFGHDDPKLGHNDWTFSSDHAPFHRKEIPFIYFGVEDHKDYHQASDIFENTNLDFYVDAIDLIIKAIVEYDQSNQE